MSDRKNRINEENPDGGDPKKDESSKDRMREAEIKAFTLVDPKNAKNFDDKRYGEFREAFRLITSEGVRGDLIVQLLDKLNLRPYVHKLRDGSPVRSSSLNQDFVLRVIGNRTADICSHELDKFQSLKELKSYLKKVLESTFFDKLDEFIKTFLNASSLDADDEDSPNMEIPVQDEGLLGPEYDELRNLVNTVVEDLVKNLANAQEWHRYEVLRARAIEKKRFPEIAQEFNALYNDALSVDTYRYRYNDTVTALEKSGALKELNDDVRLLKEQLEL